MSDFYWIEQGLTVSHSFTSPCRYANNGSFEKAIADFEVALKEHPNHVNATNYMAETLVAYAKQWVIFKML